MCASARGVFCVTIPGRIAACGRPLATGPAGGEAVGKDSAVVSTVTVQPTDHEPAGPAAPSDRTGFAALYERYFAEIYNFAMRIVRNPDTAADVVQSTFASAWTQFQKGQPPQQPRPWLYAIARNKAIDELRQRRRAVAVVDNDQDAPPAFALIDPSKLANPEAAAQDQELVELVWDAAAALNPSEYSLLDMHLRLGLRPDELAAALGVKPGNIYTKLSRLRTSLEEAVTSALLLRRGRPACRQLDTLLTDLGADELNRELRAAIQQHLKACERCQESKRRFVSPAEIFAGFAVIAAAPGLRAAIWERTASATEGATAGGGAAGPTEIAGRVGQRLAHASMASKVAVAAVAAAVIAGITTIDPPRGGCIRFLCGTRVPGPGAGADDRRIRPRCRRTHRFRRVPVRRTGVHG